MVTVNEYARQRGRAVADIPSPPAPLPLAGEGRKLPALSAAAQARVHENRALVREHLPEALPFIKELHELGMIAGWRAVEVVEVFPNSKPEGQP